MTLLRGSVLAALCLAAACHDTPSGSRGSDNARPVEGTGHTGAVEPARRTAGDPEVSPNAPSASAATTANPAPATPPSGTGNSNSDVSQTMGSPAAGTPGDAGVADAGSAKR